MNTSLTLTLNQLASLIGSFAFPDPDGDDSLVHGPGGPRVRTSVLAEIRRVTIAVTQWAETLGEQTMANLAEEEPKTARAANAKSGSRPSRGSQVEEDVSAAGDCATDVDCTPGTDSVHKKQPPARTMDVIAPAIARFVRGLLSGQAARLPIAISREANPWVISGWDKSHSAQILLVAGAQFEFAAAATPFLRLGAVFRRAAQALIERGLELIGRDLATSRAV